MTALKSMKYHSGEHVDELERSVSVLSFALPLSALLCFTFGCVYLAKESIIKLKTNDTILKTQETSIEKTVMESANGRGNTIWAPCFHLRSQK